MILTDPVSLRKCESYDADKLNSVMRACLDDAGVTPDMFSGKRVMIKPNLLLGYAPECAATTHPSVVAAAARIAFSYGAVSVTVAESPGGLYTEAALRQIYRACGMNTAADESGAQLNFDCGSSVLHGDSAKICGNFNILAPLFSADILLNLCKLKTHSLMRMTCASKNFFGLIPGIEKFEMHARFGKKGNEFTEMLIDLCDAVHTFIPTVNICDAVLAMEGNGPSAGSPRELGYLLCSRNAFSLDVCASVLIGLENRVPMLKTAQQRGLCPASLDDIAVKGEDPRRSACADFTPADTSLKTKFDLIPKWLEPHPVISKKDCRGCGICVRSCPAHTIEMRDKQAYIKKKDCIRCYCCQELCIHKAVRIKRNVLYKIFK